ncbi:MAG: AAA family ATPase [Actinomycetota bacterium]|nr:AAA family ATPase [Actinomycetota bacterium]
MDQHKVSSASAIGGGETFRSVAERHRADVARTRERNRQRRLAWILVFSTAFLVYFLKRLIEGDPLQFGWPSLGADAVLWLFPIAMILVIGLGVLGPLVINGRSPHIRFSPEEIGIRFADVRGIDILLEEVTRTLQIFLTYKTFRDDLGGNPRRGILFEGKPGTGKTHMAKAMAAEAGVPFLFVSAPAFHSMFFGMTSFRIRSFFKSLRKAARKEGGAIGFIEEMDAVGSARGGMDGFSGQRVSQFGSPSSGGGMVNEFLVQLQSFDTPPFWQRVKNLLIDGANKLLPDGRRFHKKIVPYSNVLIIGATNRADSLDPALLRPGRFDRTLNFDLPSKAGRRELVDYFLERRAHSADMDREDIREELSAMTLGYTPAMLEHILDEGLVWAIREDRRELSWRDVQRARLSEEIGIAQPVAYTDNERVLIATHEAGHAVAAFMCAAGERKLEVLSIIKRRQALGLLAHSDAEERFTRTQSELEARLKIMLAGMACEEIFFGESGTGPSSDLMAATEVVAQMVGSYGMGESLVSYEAIHEGPYSNTNIVARVLSNEKAKKEVDDVLRRQKDQVVYLLQQNRDLVEALRDALLEHEELMGDEINACVEQALERRTADRA